mmetsp:Transcript_55064/g.49566  ORF Transcript_55064/g.49566 Transcript_55064/m.49566 type:complete len:337 (-) Transcript_55064:193-1203(-)
MPKRRSTENRRCNSNGDKKTFVGKNIDHFDGLRSIKNIGAGDSYYIPNFISCANQRDEIFSKLLKEVEFEQMFNFTPNCKNKKVAPIPRLVTAQTNKDNDICDKYPIYRMPGCNEKNIQTKNWTSTVEQIRQKASDYLGNQELNHCVVTLYRDENDSLGFHKDKLLDLKPNSLILSLSFGAPRPILFYAENTKNKGKRKKKQQHRQCIILQPGSLLAIGPQTNKLYKHSIPKLKEKCLPRISLSMRTIDTFVQNNKNDEKDTKIIGKGEEFQNLNWPFAKNYDKENEYDQQTIDQMTMHKQNAIKNLEFMKKEFDVNGNKVQNTEIVNDDEKDPLD